MKDIKVSIMVLAGLGVVGAVIIAVSLVSIFNVRDVNKSYATGITNQATSLNQAISAVGAIRAICAELQSCVIYDSAGQKEKIRDTRESIDNYCKVFEDSAAAFGKGIVRPYVRKVFNDAMDKYNSPFKSTVYNLADDAENGVPTAEMLERLNGIVKPAAELITDNIMKAADIKAERLNQAPQKNAAHRP